jgi:hypothetical protein
MLKQGILGIELAANSLMDELTNTSKKEKGQLYSFRQLLQKSIIRDQMAPKRASGNISTWGGQFFEIQKIETNKDYNDGVATPCEVDVEAQSPSIFEFFN